MTTKSRRPKITTVRSGKISLITREDISEGRLTFIRRTEDFKTGIFDHYGSLLSVKAFKTGSKQIPIVEFKAEGGVFRLKEADFTKIYSLEHQSGNLPDTIENVESWIGM